MVSVRQITILFSSSMHSDYFGSNHTQETVHTFVNTANTNRSMRKGKCFKLFNKCTDCAIIVLLNTNIVTDTQYILTSV